MPTEEYFDDNVNEGTVGTGGFDTVAPGFYLVRVANVNETDSNLEIDMEIMPGGTKPAEVNKVHREFVSLNSKDGNRKRRLAFALACNILTRDHIKNAREQGHGLVIDYPSAVGQFCVIEIEHDAKNVKNSDGEWVPDPTGKVQSKIPYDHIWHIDDKSVAKKGVKIDREKLATSNAFGGDMPKPPEEAKSDF